MKLTKNIGLLNAFLLLATNVNTWSMNEQPVGWGSWIYNTISSIILGDAEMNTLWQPTSEFPLHELAAEIKDKIIHLLSLKKTATTLQETTFSINALAQVNHELHDLINDPEFCLRIIKQLAQQFNCSDEQAANALQTKEAKRRLQLQNNLQMLCNNPMRKETIYLLQNIPSLEELYAQGVDLNFTYSIQPPNIQSLDDNLADVQSTITYTLTPLIMAALSSSHMIIRICRLNDKLLKINQPDSTGATPLIVAIQGKRNSQAIQALLNAGADPELAHSNGVTPLALARKKGNQKIINLIEEAIAKKHSGNK